MMREEHETKAVLLFIPRSLFRARHFFCWHPARPALHL
jgi:hypothetical protein